MKYKYLKIAGGIVLIPIIFILFMIDRVILMILFWQDSPSIFNYYNKRDQIMMALYRFAGVLALLGIVQLLKWIINGI